VQRIGEIGPDCAAFGAERRMTHVTCRDQILGARRAVLMGIANPIPAVVPVGA